MCDKINRVLKQVKEELKGGAKPSEETFFNASRGSYEPTAPLSNNGFELIYDGRTLDAYLDKDTKTIIIGVRGTWDVKDIKADAFVLQNRLKGTSRYKENVEDMDNIIHAFPPEEYEYWISGHSLGGAISYQMLRDYPFIQGSVDYSSAFQSWDITHQNPNSKKLYTNEDFLYRLGGFMFKNKQVVPVKKPQGLAKRLFGLTPVGLVKRGVEGHFLTNFEDLYSYSGK